MRSPHSQPECNKYKGNEAQYEQMHNYLPIVVDAIFSKPIINSAMQTERSVYLKLLYRVEVTGKFRKIKMSRC
ncbi:hypothetical protein METHB2_520009 [Candidatus Methylobacter favarea]|uniref:Uncharacterized protein n=1 Tax=Candidatus Methylobacter favarea TaxID=2707345 RepID=A0A8S0X2G8_9GAMM|nr:hypothetical protein METHB2_520009 [Candidatus Methylobacter favarea]